MPPESPLDPGNRQGGSARLLDRVPGEARPLVVLVGLILAGGAVFWIGTRLGNLGYLTGWPLGAVLGLAALVGAGFVLLGVWGDRRADKGAPE